MSYVGFEIIRLTKCKSGNDGKEYISSHSKSDELKDNPFFFYEWTHWTRGGLVVKQEEKVDLFLSIVKSRSITQGRIGFFKRDGSSKWNILTESMFEEMLIDWIDLSTRMPIKDDDEEAV